MSNNNKNKQRRCPICDYCEEAPTTDQYLYGTRSKVFFVKDHKTNEWLCNLCYGEILDTIYEDILLSEEGDEYKYLFQTGEFDPLSAVDMKVTAEMRKKNFSGKKTGARANPHGRAGKGGRKDGWNPGDPVPDPRYTLEQVFKATETGSTGPSREGGGSMVAAPTPETDIALPIEGVCTEQSPPSTEVEREVERHNEG